MLFVLNHLGNYLYGCKSTSTKRFKGFYPFSEGWNPYLKILNLPFRIKSRNPDPRLVNQSNFAIYNLDT